MNKPVIVVFGATGNTGRAVTQHLLKHDNITTRAIVRSKEKGAELSKKGAEVIEADWNDDSSLDKALNGASRIWITAPNPSKEQKAFDRTNLAKKVITRAKSNGHVQFILVGSVHSADLENITFSKEFRDLEKAVESSGIPWCHLRMTAFQENIMGCKSNLSKGVYPQPLGPNGGTPFCPVSIEDVGEMAAVILTNPDSHKNKIYTLTGPESLTGQQQAEAVGRALGKTINYSDWRKEEALETFKSLMSEYQAKGMMELYELFEKGYAKDPSPDFEHVVGHKGTRLEERLKTLHNCGAI